jgi:hypothetical protein
VWAVPELLGKVLLVVQVLPLQIDALEEVAVLVL